MSGAFSRGFVNLKGDFPSSDALLNESDSSEETSEIDLPGPY